MQSLFITFDNNFQTINVETSNVNDFKNQLTIANEIINTIDVKKIDNLTCCIDIDKQHTQHVLNVLNANFETYRVENDAIYYKNNLCVFFDENNLTLSIHLSKNNIDAIIDINNVLFNVINYIHIDVFTI